MTALPPEAMTEDDQRRVVEILSFATNPEQAGDVVDKGLVGIVAKHVKRCLAFSPAGASWLFRGGGEFIRVEDTCRAATHRANASDFARAQCPPSEGDMAKLEAREAHSFEKQPCSRSQSTPERFRASRHFDGQATRYPVSVR
jgi:hypothetical protein